MGIREALFDLDAWVDDLDVADAFDDELALTWDEADALTYVVQPGDTLTRIAGRFRIPDWRTIYNHPTNAGFRRLRPNPDRIFAGDRLFIPESTPPAPPDPPPPPPPGGGGAPGGGGGQPGGQ